MAANLTPGSKKDSYPSSKNTPAPNAIEPHGARLTVAPPKTGSGRKSLKG